MKKLLCLCLVLLLSLCFLKPLSAQIATELYVPCLGSSGCVADSEIYVVGGSVIDPGAPGQPGVIHGDGETIDICYRISTYVSLGANWHHGTEVETGPGWSPLSAGSATNGPGGGASGSGNWIWYDYNDNCAAGPCSSPGSNAWGWWYESGQNVQCNGSPFDGDASNNLGDANNTGLTQWEYCIEVVTDCGPVTGEIDTQIDFVTWAHSESGSGSTCGCEGGAVECTIPLKIVCCEAPDLSGIFADANCSDLLTELLVSGDTANPNYTYDWQGPNGPGPQGVNQPIWTFSQGNAPAGEYVLSVSNAADGNCVRELYYTSYAGGDGSDFSAQDVCLGSSEEIRIYPDPGSSLDGVFSGPLCSMVGVDCNVDSQTGVPVVIIQPSVVAGQGGLPGTCSNLIYSVGGVASPCFSFNVQSVCFLQSPPAPSVLPSVLNVCIGDPFPGVTVSPNLGWEYHWYQTPKFGLSQAEIATGTSSLTSWPTHIDPSTPNVNGDPYLLYLTAVSQATGCPGPWTEIEVYLEDCNLCAPNVDNDSDGLCSDVDCDDNDPQIGVIGDPCDDGNANTSNDFLQNDCTCQGIPIACAVPDADFLVDQSFCGSGQVLLPDWEDFFFNPSAVNTISGVQYFLDPGNATIPPTNQVDATTIYSLMTGDECTASEYQVFAFLNCISDTNGDGLDDLIPAGSFSVVVFPDPTDWAISISNAGACCPSLSGACLNENWFDVVNDYDGNGANPDCSSETMNGSMEFTVVNSYVFSSSSGLFPTPVECAEFSYTVSYDCQVCPDPGGCDDGDCSNGIEIWDSVLCTCVNIAPIFGCTDASAINYDPLADCDDGSCANASSLNLSLFLEGYTMTNGVMRTLLSTNGLLPLNQPYNVAPYFYPGTESVTNHSADIVDWILVELRDVTDPNIVVERKALRLRNDGVVLGLNGETNINWNNAGSYHIVVKHRSHLGIQSAQPVDIANGASLDFSGAIAEASGQDQQVLANGKVAMRSGDYDSNGTVNFFDFISWLQNNNVLNVYHPADGDGNGGINFFDFILWLQNQNVIGVASVQ